MKKTALLLAVYMAVLVCFTACGTKSANDKKTDETTTSEQEKMSYFDSLADTGGLSDKEVTDPSALYIIDDTNGSRELLDDAVYADMISTFNRIYPDIFYKYGNKNTYEPYRITLALDATYLRNVPASVSGNTININIDWFNKYPERVSVLIYYIARTVLDYNSSAPEWVIDSVNYYMAAEFSAYGYAFTNGYQGGSYEDGGEVGADFLRWVGEQYGIDIVYRINRTLNSATWFESDFWTDETGKTLDQLWSDYKAA